jgi:hypothetical protein
MSGHGVLFHRPANAGEAAREAVAGPVDPNARRVPGAAVDLRDFGGVEPLPGDEREELTIVGTQTRKRGRGGTKTGVRPAGIGLARDIVLDALSQSLAPPLAALLVGHHASRGPVEPKPCRLAGRDLVEPSPGGEERLGDYVSRVVATYAPQRVPEHVVVVRLIDGLKAITS